MRCGGRLPAGEASKESQHGTQRPLPFKRVHHPVAASSLPVRPPVVIAGTAGCGCCTIAMAHRVATGGGVPPAGAASNVFASTADSGRCTPKRWRAHYAGTLRKNPTSDCAECSVGA